MKIENRRKGSCTTVLVGRKASIDGSTMIARNDDGHEALDPQRFVVVHPDEQPRHYKAVLSGLELDLPENPLRYTSTPNAVLAEGIWPAAGINSENVAMSATETITTNPRILGLDPYVADGMGEEDLVTLVLPYVKTAREGVERLGELLATYGTYEPNGIAFADHKEVWWLETIGGHHWAAVRIPDDAYVVAPNRMNIDDFKFNSEGYLCSSDLKNLIDENHLNPDLEGYETPYNLRHIFGSSSIKDSVYNNPRTWYGQNFLGTVSEDPQNQELPFICEATRKITVEDVKFVLSSHFENTSYDPYGTTNTPEERKLFRPIGINRNHSVHILQVRNHVPKELAGVQWLAFGANTFNHVVPFYTAITDTPACYRDAKGEYDPTNMYWLSATTAVLGDSNYDLFVDLRNTFELNTMAKFHEIQNETDRGFDAATDKLAYLTEANEKLAAVAFKNQTELLGRMVVLGSANMKLRFDFND
ncbi:C69 family dipeptidase [Lactococcus taiwanensis]|uniref:C69 family dipeptidase n=1 Tax=Lactococcus taiwanensis TaxID=1151742 RepID=UPI001964FA5F|nr:C69 family dipeptidase [Lactococcus taiwanensis]QRZ11310.1 C69 family dipeptidase [Lactococcus taiwanensis]